MIGILLLSGVVVGILWFLASPFRTGLWSIPGPWWRRYSGLSDSRPSWYDTSDENYDFQISSKW